MAKINWKLWKLNSKVNRVVKNSQKPNLKNCNHVFGKFLMSGDKKVRNCKKCGLQEVIIIRLPDNNNN